MTELEEMAYDSLRQIVDPEIGINIVDLGLVYEVEQTADGVRVVMTFTTEACPVAPRILVEVEEAIADLPGAPFPDVRITFDPPWTPDMISSEGRTLLGS